MIDTSTTFDELSQIMNKKPEDFYSRISTAKYYETTKYVKKGEGMPWNWMCKIGLKDGSFAVRMTSFGVLGDSILLAHKDPKKKQIYEVLTSYARFLSSRMRPVVKTLNSKFNNPAN